MPLPATTIVLRPGELVPTTVRLRDLSQSSTFQVNANISVSLSATILAPVRLRLFPEIDISTIARLTGPSQLSMASSITVAQSSSLTIVPRLTLAAGVPVSSALALSQQSFLATSPTIQISTSPKLRAGATMALQGTVSVASNLVLTRVQQHFSVTSSLQVSMFADATRQQRGVVIITINGVINTNVRYQTITITDILNEAPNTCHFIIDGTKPLEGSDIKIGLVDTSIDHLLFAGTIQSVQQYFEGKKVNVAWQVSCIDYTWLFNRRKVWGNFKNVSATTIAQTIVSSYTSGFSSSGIQAGLPAVTLKFDALDPSAAMSNIAAEIAGYTQIEYSKVVTLRTTQDPTHPADVDDVSLLTLSDPPLRYTVDLTQLRTRVYVKGKSVQVIGDSGLQVLPFDNVIPVEDATPFSAGQVITDEFDFVNYTGTIIGGVSSLVTANTAAGPASGGNPTLATGIPGSLVGFYTYVVSFANATGESLVGPISPGITVNAVSSPTNGIGIGPTGSAGPLVGAYTYAVTFVTATGETLIGPTTSRTANALVAGTPSIISQVAGMSKLGAGTYNWKVTYVTDLGETAGSNLASALMTPVGFTVTSPNVSTGSTSGPLLPASTYGYKITFTTAQGETSSSNAAIYNSPGLSLPSLSGITAITFGGLFGGPYSYGVSVVTSKGESPISPVFVGSGFFTGSPSQAPTWTGQQDPGLGRIQPGFTYVYAASWYSDKYGEGPLGPSFTLNVGGSQVIRVLMNVPTGNFPFGRADGLRVYRAIQPVGNVNGTAFQLNIDFRASNGIPSQWIDALSQGECGAFYPAHTNRNAGVGMQITIGSAGEVGVVARRLYRTQAGASAFQLVLEIDNNNPISVIDNKFDSELGQYAQLAATTGRTSVLTNIPLGPTGVTGRNIYRTKTNGSLYYLLGTLTDNITQTFPDDIADQQLSQAMPPPSFVGSFFNNGFQATVLLPAGPQGVRARRIYRTKLGGGGAYQLAGEVRDNTTPIFTDNSADTELSANTVPSNNTAGGEQHTLTSIQIGTSTFGGSILARRVYRTEANKSELKLLAQISDNSSTLLVDSADDSVLGASIPLVNTAGGSAVDLLAVPVGPGGITQRLIYRTAASGSAFKFVGSLDDNVSTNFRDTKADLDLGRSPLINATIGPSPGDVRIGLLSAKGFPSNGWVKVGSLHVRYTGIGGNDLIGIPPTYLGTSITRNGTSATFGALSPLPFLVGERVTIGGADQSDYNGVHEVLSNAGTSFTFLVSGSAITPATTLSHFYVGGPGSITAPIPGSTEALSVPLLTGVSNNPNLIPVGSNVAIWVRRDSLTGQSAVAAKEGGDGVHEFVINDSTRDTVAAATARADAELITFQFGIIQVNYPSTDTGSKSGRTVHFNLGAPHNITGDFLIQQVEISNVSVSKDFNPLYQVTATNAKFSIADLIRHLTLNI